MSTKRFAFGSVAMVAALALGLSACSSGSDSGSDSSASPTASDTAAAGGGNNAGKTVRVWLIQPDKNNQGPANEWLISEFEKQTGAKLVIEEQQWSSYKSKYLTTLSGSDAPDVVEMGNTDTPAFTSVGALTDLTDKKEDLGGSDLLPGFVDIGSYNGKFFAPPYYSGARVVFYAPGTMSNPVPTTLTDYVAAGVAAKKDAFSGIYAPGKDWYNVLPYVWANGGWIAKEEGGKWEAGFSSEGGVKGLTMAQEVMTKANSQTVAPADGDESKGTDVFCEGKIGYLEGPTWLGGSILAPVDAEAPGCPDTFGKDLTAFALPGLTAGTVAPTFAGGSNLGIPAKSKNPELAYEALKLIVSPTYQGMLAEKGFIPALISEASKLPQDKTTQEGAKAAAEAILTPASPKWSEVEAKKYLQDAFTRLAQGNDPKTVGTDLDKQIEDTLNAS